MVDRTPEISHLEKISLFKSLNERALADVLMASANRRIPADTYLFMQGDPAEKIFVLVEGQMKLSQVSSDGQQIILRYAVPGEAIGVVAVLSHSIYPVTAESVEDSTLLYWDRVEVLKLMQRYPEIAVNAIALLASRVREFQDRIRELSTERVERRIARALLRLAQQTGRRVQQGVLIDIPLSRQDLAEMTGTTLFTVSRTLKNWENMGLIVSGRERVTIRSPHALVTIAEDLPDRNLEE